MGLTTLSFSLASDAMTVVRAFKTNEHYCDILRRDMSAFTAITNCSVFTFSGSVSHGSVLPMMGQFSRPSINGLLRCLAIVLCIAVVIEGSLVR